MLSRGSLVGGEKHELGEAFCDGGASLRTTPWSNIFSGKLSAINFAVTHFFFGMELQTAMNHVYRNVRKGHK